jgi:hypothetical protein
MPINFAMVLLNPEGRLIASKRLRQEREALLRRKVDLQEKSRSSAKVVLGPSKRLKPLLLKQPRHGLMYELRPM